MKTIYIDSNEVEYDSNEMFIYWNETADKLEYPFYDSWVEYMLRSGEFRKKTISG